jgi:hypothetical protein
LKKISSFSPGEFFNNQLCVFGLGSRPTLIEAQNLIEAIFSHLAWPKTVLTANYLLKEREIYLILKLVK